MLIIDDNKLMVFDSKKEDWVQVGTVDLERLKEMQSKYREYDRGLKEFLISIGCVVFLKLLVTVGFLIAL